MVIVLKISKLALLTKSKLGDKLGDKLGNGLGNGLGDKLGKTERKILNEILANNQISITQMADKLNISTTTIENNLSKLKETGIINRKGSAKGGYWEINTKKLGDSLGEKLGDVLTEKHFNLSKNEQLIL